MKQRNFSKRLFVNCILIGLFILFFCAVFFLPSVLNKNPQIQSKLLVTAIGIDRSQEGEIEFSGVCVLPDSGQESKVKSITVTSKARSVAECIEFVSEQYGKQVELGLCGLVVIGESTDGESVLPHLEFLLSSASVSPGAYLIYAQDGKASELLEYASSQNPSTAEILSSVVEFNDKTARIATKTLLEFLSETHGVSTSSLLPSVKVQKSSEGKQNAVVGALNSSVVYENGIKTGELDSEQTLGYNLATQNADKGLFAVDNLVLAGENLGRIDCWIYSAKNGKTAYYDNGVPIIKLSVEVVLQFQDQHKIIRAWKKNGKKESDITKPLLKGFEDKIKEQVLSAFNRSKMLNSDIFAVKTEFYRFHTKRYLSEESTDFLQKVQPKIEVKVSFK